MLSVLRSHANRHETGTRELGADPEPPRPSAIHDAMGAQARLKGLVEGRSTPEVCVTAVWGPQRTRAFPLPCKGDLLWQAGWSMPNLGERSCQRIEVAGRPSAREGRVVPTWSISSASAPLPPSPIHVVHDEGEGKVQIVVQLDGDLVATVRHLIRTSHRQASSICWNSSPPTYGRTIASRSNVAHVPPIGPGRRSPFSRPVQSGG